MTHLQKVQFLKAIKLNPEIVTEVRKRLTISDCIRNIISGLRRTSDKQKAVQTVRYSFEVNNLLRKAIKWN